MDQFVALVVAIIQITLLDITLSGDNVSVIALAIRNLPKEQAKLASLIGVGGAVAVGVLFTCIIIADISMGLDNVLAIAGAGLLIYTALTMITEDNLTSRYITHIVSVIIPALAGFGVVSFGVFSIRKNAKNYEVTEREEVVLKSIS